MFPTTFGVGVSAGHQLLLEVELDLDPRSRLDLESHRGLQSTAQFMWSAIFVNKHGLDAYNDLTGNKIPWTDPRAVDVTATMKKIADDKMFEDSFNSLDLGPGMVLFVQGKALHWYQGSFNLGRFRGDQPECCVVPIDFFPMPQNLGP